MHAVRVGSLVGLGLWTAVGCASAGATSDVGNDADFVAHPPDAGPAPPHDAAVGDLAGDHWDGTVDGDPFPSGSHRVQIIFDHATGFGARTGVIVLGMAPPPSPPHDPSVGYPRDFGISTIEQPFAATEGFVYPIVEGIASATHLHVVASGLGPWEPWCELQTPVPLGGDDVGFGCLPLGGGAQSGNDCIYEPGNGPAYPIDCGRMLLCQPPGYCDCTADGCSARLRDPITFELDIALDDATGTVTLQPTRTVHMTRM